MKIQYQITSLFALNYAVALFVADRVGPTLFLCLLQPAIVFLIGKLLCRSIPPSLRYAARENHVRLDGTRSEGRKQVEVTQLRQLRLRIYLLLVIATIAVNFALMGLYVVADQLPHLLYSLIPAYIGLIGLAAFEFTRRCFLYLLSEHGNQITKRHMEYVKLDMGRIQYYHDNTSPDELHEQVTQRTEPVAHVNS